MVLRKPYAFLIKHFRLIHIIITAIFAYIAIKNREIYLYLNKVITSLANRYDANMYINYGIYVLFFLAIILCAVIYYLLKYKNKPRKIYIFTIAGYIIVGIFTIILYNFMSTFANVVIDQKTIRLYRDLLLITLLFQYYIVILMFIRGMGFDIKKFDFNKDSHELNIDNTDNEEVEVNTNIDTTNIMRSVRKNSRELGYFYQEFKVYILIIIFILLIFIGFKFYNYISVKYKLYTENELVGSVNEITIKESHLINRNNKNYVIINFDISKYGIKEQFNINNLVLEIDDKEYLPDKNICNNFNKYGTCYKKQFITNDVNNYIAVYQIENNSPKNSYLVYKEFYDSIYKIQLTLK